MDRDTRNLQHTKQRATSVNQVANVDKNTLTEGVPRVMYIKNYGLRMVVKYNNEIWYGTLSTTLS